MTSGRRLSAIVLAAGQGTRMKSARPKPLHRLCGRTMVGHVLGALPAAEVSRAVGTDVQVRSLEIDACVDCASPFVLSATVAYAPQGGNASFVGSLAASWGAAGSTTGTRTRPAGTSCRWT